MYQRLIGLLVQSGARAGKSVINAYRRVVDAKTDGEKMHSQTMNEFKEQMGSLIKTPMTREEALAAITKALAATVGSVDADVTEDTNLVDDGLLDSLDSMTFLFELENDLGTKLEAIDETYDDFRVGSIVDIVVAATV